METDLKELLNDTGKVVEASGRMLQRNREFTYSELTDLTLALSESSKAILSVRNTNHNRED